MEPKKRGRKPEQYEFLNFENLEIGSPCTYLQHTSNGRTVKIPAILVGKGIDHHSGKKTWDIAITRKFKLKRTDGTKIVHIIKYSHCWAGNNNEYIAPIKSFDYNSIILISGDARSRRNINEYIDNAPTVGEFSLFFKEANTLADKTIGKKIMEKVSYYSNNSSPRTDECYSIDLYHSYEGTIQIFFRTNNFTNVVTVPFMRKEEIPLKRKIENMITEAKKEISSIFEEFPLLPEDKSDSFYTDEKTFINDRKTLSSKHYTKRLEIMCNWSSNKFKEFKFPTIYHFIKNSSMKTIFSKFRKNMTEHDFPISIYFYFSCKFTYYNSNLVREICYLMKRYYKIMNNHKEYRTSIRKMLYPSTMELLCL